jgi:hypothetical protein
MPRRKTFDRLIVFLIKNIESYMLPRIQESNSAILRGESIHDGKDVIGQPFK